MWSVDTKKEQFLDQAKSAREERQQEKYKMNAVIHMQRCTRGFLDRRRVKRQIRKDLDDVLKIPESQDCEYSPSLVPAVDVFKLTKGLLFILDSDVDHERFDYLCRYILISMESESLKVSYVAVALNKKYTLEWIQQLKNVLSLCCSYLRVCKPELHQDARSMMVYLRMLVTFTSTVSWKILKGKAGETLGPGMNQLCSNVMGHLNSVGLYPILENLLTRGLARSKPLFNRATLTAIITIGLRPLLAADFSEKLMTMFVLHILSVPATIYHINLYSQECLNSLVTHRVFTRCVQLMSSEQSTRIIFNSLEGNYALCLMANLIQLGYTELEGLVDNTTKFMHILIRLLDSCKMYVQSKRSNLTQWHPVLGWFSQSTNTGLHEAMPFVVKQLQLLWGEKMIRILFSELLEYVSNCAHNSKSQASPSRNILKKAFEKAKSSTPTIKLDSTVSNNSCLPCALYRRTMQTLSQLRNDILGGLSYNDILLPILWKFLTDLGPNCGLKMFLDLLRQAPNSTLHSVFSLLTLFCETATHLLTTLDDMEMYEQQKVFKLSDYTKLGAFLNMFVFKVIWNGLIDVQTASKSDVFTSVHGLLMILLERDARRRYAPNDHWIISDLKMSVFLVELERGRKTSQFLMQKAPHIVPFHERVVLFRKNVQREKEAMGLLDMHWSPHTTLVTIHRSRIVEDGYRQLAQVNATAMKGIIRVKFINEQGLDEAGIDQDGVFKEFLEETVARVFDPSLNLFKVTSEQKLYPSSTSYIQENHLALFEFVGKMLGKAVYEGIVVDIPFASFFLTQMLGRQHSATYSSLDELPSLDPELSKSLNYVKHYEGDVSDLDLTFSCDEDCMGQLQTHELVPGGKAITVTSENKIRYVHLMAHFRMHRQIRDQTAAFIRGFQRVVNQEWLQMFSAPELQKLISGDNTEIDTEDLRRHTQYYGGYHNNHKVINWLWEVVSKELSSDEKALFLKFVTSCSKPPLLGFAHLEPPFSIRCVEVSDDQDTGDTVGSVIKGFFNIKKKDAGGRLPTSSTCFNLLKLPNYSKRSLLRDKLRYAIHSHSGFEIS